MAGNAKEVQKRASFQHDLSTVAMTFTRRQAWAGLAAVSFFALMVWKVLTRGWFMMEMAGLFVIMGASVGLIAGLSTDKICEAFNEGFRDVLVGAMIVGLAAHDQCIDGDAKGLEVSPGGLREDHLVQRQIRNHTLKSLVLSLKLLHPSSAAN